jgi:hypothetical protein
MEILKCQLTVKCNIFQKKTQKTHKNVNKLKNK